MLVLIPHVSQNPLCSSLIFMLESQTLMLVSQNPLLVLVPFDSHNTTPHVSNKPSFESQFTMVKVSDLQGFPKKKVSLVLKCP